MSNEYIHCFCFLLSDNTPPAAFGLLMERAGRSDHDTVDVLVSLVRYLPATLPDFPDAPSLVAYLIQLSSQFAPLLSPEICERLLTALDFAHYRTLIEPSPTSAPLGNRARPSATLPTKPPRSSRMKRPFSIQPSNDQLRIELHNACMLLAVLADKLVGMNHFSHFSIFGIFL